MHGHESLVYLLLVQRRIDANFAAGSLTAFEMFAAFGVVAAESTTHFTGSLDGFRRRTNTRLLTRSEMRQLRMSTVETASREATLHIT